MTGTSPDNAEWIRRKCNVSNEKRRGFPGDGRYNNPPGPIPIMQQIRIAARAKEILKNHFSETLGTCEQDAATATARSPLTTKHRPGNRQNCRWSGCHKNQRRTGRPLSRNSWRFAIFFATRWNTNEHGLTIGMSPTPFKIAWLHCRAILSPSTSFSQRAVKRFFSSGAANFFGS